MDRLRSYRFRSGETLPSNKVDPLHVRRFVESLQRSGFASCITESSVILEIEDAELSRCIIPIGAFSLKRPPMLLVRPGQTIDVMRRGGAMLRMRATAKDLVVL